MDLKEKGYKLVSREYHPLDSIIKVNDLTIGGKNIIIMAGPCAVENEEQISKIATNIKATGANILRGGTYKLRTSPYAFQGLHEDGLILLNKVAKSLNMPCISEITAIEQIPLFSKYCDIIQVGARNMFNYDLLKALGKTKKPILLKRGIGATIEELLAAAEYILANGNPNVILCERGIRTYENSQRNTLDLASVAYLKQLTHLPVVVDPSHGTGLKELVKDMSLAAIAAKADGLIIEVNDNPEIALSDGYQAISSTTLKEIITKGKKIREII